MTTRDGPVDERTKTEVLDDASRAELVRVLLFWDGGGTMLQAKPGARITLGRSSDCDVRVDHISVSRAHAALTLGLPPTIEDLESSNGVRVRGARITPCTPTAFAAGDTVELGSVVLVVQQPLRLATEGESSRSTQGVTAIPDAANDTAMAAVTRMIELVAKSDINVLILGETGVGKGVTAETIHRQSARRLGPLVRLNCPAFPEALLESELFGYERGAFSGATQSKPGLIESAGGGTLFLDEIAEISPVIQAKLLGVLDNREVLRLGSVKSRRIDVRVLAATNRDMDRFVRSGGFRPDLYFRLNGVSVTVPPLRARLDAIPGFARAFLEAACRGRRSAPVISEDAMRWLLAHDWPGNLRELKNLMDRVSVLCTSGCVTREHVDTAPLASETPGETGRTKTGVAGSDSSSSPSLRTEMESLERRRIEEALGASQGNQTKAAKLLGLSRRALITRIEAFGLPRPRKRDG